MKGMSTSDIEDHNGRKDVLGMWAGENESAKFWAGVLNSIKNRGVKDILHITVLSSSPGVSSLSSSALLCAKAPRHPLYNLQCRLV